jgi:hypothetical protein
MRSREEIVDLIWPEVDLNEAMRIADVPGVYTGWGTFGSETHAFLLFTGAASVPGPGTLVFLGLGGIALLSCIRCHRGR